MDLVEEHEESERGITKNAKIKKRTIKEREKETVKDRKEGQQKNNR